MSVNFRIIVFTHPEKVENEGEKICDLLENGVDYVHLRKPGLNVAYMRRLLETIESRFHERIRIHDNFQLCDEFSLAGVHLNSRNPESVASARSMTRSLHSISELESLKDAGKYSYLTLSPIFPSISKPGYHGDFDLDTIGDSIRGKRIVALGGVRPEMMELLREKGFWGAALLGYIWDGNFNIKKLKKCCSL